MIELVKVTSVKALEGYRLRLCFSDGSEGVEDLTEYLHQGGEMIEPLREPVFFRRVFISCGVPTWPNGFALDAIALHMGLNDTGGLSRAAAAE